MNGLPAFPQALADLRWTNGRNVRMDVRWAGGDINRIRTLAQRGIPYHIRIAVGSRLLFALQGLVLWRIRFR